jgi:hypothetical protein
MTSTATTPKAVTTSITVPAEVRIWVLDGQHRLDAVSELLAQSGEHPRTGHAHVREG